MQKRNEINENDLFDNAWVRAAANAMSDEQKEQYKKIGEKMYGNMNFEDPQFRINPDVAMSRARDCLEGQLRSGLHPSDMEENEKAVMVDAYGEKWYKKWGYTEKDLVEITAIKK